MKKYIKSNIGFIISMILLTAIAFNPQLKSLVLQGLLKTGLFEPDIGTARNTGATLPGGGRFTKAPSVIFRSPEGERIDIADPAGKVVFLNFWAPWCPPCIAEMPAIQALKSKFKSQDVLFVMADADDDPERAGAFMKKHQYNLRVFSIESSIPESLFKGTLPSTAIINKKGEIVFHHEGMANYDSAEIGKLINELRLNQSIGHE